MPSVLSAADYVVIGIVLAISAAVGLYFRFTGGRQKTTQEFLMADRNMGVLPVSFSLMATIMSAIALLGSPSEAYSYGAGIMTIELFFPIGVLITAYCIVPVYFVMEANTIYEYLEKRFGTGMKFATSLLFSIQMILYMPVVIYAPSLALSTVTGISVWTSVVCMAIVCTFYSTLGGLKAVLWTDLFQGILMLVTTFTLIIKGCLDFGGLYKILETAKKGGRLNMFNTSIDPTVRYSVWNTMSQGTVTGMFLLGATFTLVQRLMSCGTLKKAQCCLMWTIPLVFFFKCSSNFLGTVIYSYFHDCDPLRDKRENITSGDQLLPHFILTLFGHLPGLPGLCVAGIFSAALSTMSSVVNSLVTVTIEDYIKPYGKCRNFKDSTTTLFAKILAISYGGLCLILTFVTANVKGVIEIAIVITGMIGGPTLGVFCLGMFTVTANEPGALIGLCMGFAIHAWMGFGSLYTKSKYPPLPLSTAGCAYRANSSLYETSNSVNFTMGAEMSNFTISSDLSNPGEKYIFPLYRVSFMWFATSSFVITVISGYIASLIVGFWIKEKEVDPLQLSPVVRKWFCNYPKSCAVKECINLSDGTKKADIRSTLNECN